MTEKNIARIETTIFKGLMVGVLVLVVYMVITSG